MHVCALCRRGSTETGGSCQRAAWKQAKVHGKRRRASCGRRVGGYAHLAGVRARLALPAWVEGQEPVRVVDTKAHSTSPTTDVDDPAYVPTTIYTVHEFHVDIDAMAPVEEWLEADERDRRFVPLAEARAQVAWRRGMREALDRASITALQ